MTRQVPREVGELTPGPGGVDLGDPVRVLLGAEAALLEGTAEPLDDEVALGVGGPDVAMAHHRILAGRSCLDPPDGARDGTGPSGHSGEVPTTSLVSGDPPMSQTSPPDPAPLSERERGALAAIAAHERTVDAAFAARLSDPAPGSAVESARVRPRTLVVAAALTVLAGVVLLPGAWLLAIVAVAVLVVVPTVLVTWAVHQGRIDPDGPRGPDRPHRV